MMVFRPSAVLRPGGPGCLAARYFSSSGSRTVPLAYDLHEPPEPATDRQTSPILFLHGLFGSKKNNRTMSKCVGVLGQAE